MHKSQEEVNYRSQEKAKLLLALKIVAYLALLLVALSFFARDILPF